MEGLILIDWSLHDAKLYTSGDTKKDRLAYREKKRLDRLAPASLSYKEVKVGPVDGLSDGVKENILITSTQQRYAKTINMMPGHDFNVGSIVYWNKSRWLITQKDVEDEINKKGGMELCNDKLRWQDPDDLLIYERWITTDKPYFSNLEELRQLEISTREFKIQVAFDEYTSKIDIGKRFMIEKINGSPKTYRVTSVDTKTERYAMDDTIKGFLIINIEQDQYNPDTDNEILMIANYIPPETPPTPPVGEDYIEWIYTSDPKLKVGSPSLKKFSTNVFDENDNLIVGAITNISVEIQSWQDPNAFVIEYGDNYVSLRIKKGYEKYIGDVIGLKATYEATEDILYVEVVGLV